MLRLPFVQTRLEVAKPPADDGLRIGPVVLPSVRRTAYYLGLGTAAAVEVLEWPIAAVGAAGSFVVHRVRSAVAP
ncbi:hypothetical protein UG55_103231 [Frankia sp. EI5c]|uniref:hypothetical protein n=1 Tax=Frankia sp. EI5c TaxID=683316 RepID=UPI0007C3CAA8|nr:hypothetical protein [Frankia sp. EI5c]OAA23998.1 hypothetical protein UG55_103231 [Frankia sp. EI5c]